jgi:F0F1-type ATP synthase membrane subunit b/b'
MSSLIPLGGFGLLLWLLLSYRLIHPNTLKSLLEEKDKQIADSRADAQEWKLAYKTNEETLNKFKELLEVSERRGDAAVEAARLIADSLDKLREMMEGRKTDVVPQRRSSRGTSAG